MVVVEDNGHVRRVGLPFPADLLMESVLDGESSIALGDRGQPRVSFVRRPAGWGHRGHAVMQVDLLPCHMTVAKGSKAVAVLGDAPSRRLATRSEPASASIASPKCIVSELRTRDFFQSCIISARDCRLHRNGCHRLHRTGKTQILAETQHRFHAGIAPGAKSTRASNSRLLEGVSSTAVENRSPFSPKVPAWPVAMMRAFNFGVARRALANRQSAAHLQASAARGRLAAERKVQAQSSLVALPDRGSAGSH